MDPKWNAMGSSAPAAESETSVAVPTTPRRAAGMLDFEPPSPSLMPNKEQEETDVRMEGVAPTTPSLLSRLFSWGTPSGKPPPGQKTPNRRASASLIPKAVAEEPLPVRRHSAAYVEPVAKGYRTTPNTPLMPSNAIGSPSRSKPPTPAQDKKVPASPRPKARQSFDSPLIRAKKAPSGSVTGLRQETEDLLSTLSTPVKLRSPARHSKTPLNKRRESLDFSSVVSETSAQSVRSVALALSDLNVSNAKVDVFSSPLASARYLDPKNDELVVESDFVGGETVTFSKLSLDSLLLAESDLVPAVSIEGEDTSDKSDPLGLGNSEMIQDMPMPAFDSANDGMTSLASQETLVLQPDTLVTGDKKRKDVSEFDPLDSQDWMLRFDTPKKESRSDEEVALVDKRKQTPVRSLIDDFGPLATPNSMVKYTQRDVDRLKAEWQAKFEKEFEVAQLEIQELDEARKSLSEQNKRLKGSVAEAESQCRVVQGDREKLIAHMEKLQSLIDKMRVDKDAAVREYDLLTIKSKQMKMDYDELRENQAKLLKLQEASEEKAQALERRYDTLKAHAESKLDSANVEIARVRGAFEKESAAQKTKISRFELQIASLERNLAGKEEENLELTKICDELVQQMEALGG